MTENYIVDIFTLKSGAKCKLLNIRNDLIPNYYLICFPRLMRAFGLSENDETYDSLLAAYSEKHRAYHRLEHISACFRHLDVVS